MPPITIICQAHTYLLFAVVRLTVFLHSLGDTNRKHLNGHHWVVITGANLGDFDNDIVSLTDLR
jgi:hypothetical protein